MYQKARRQAALLKLVREGTMRNQNEVVRALRKLGFHATQASVSRDVRELGLVKARGRYLPAARVRGDGGAGEPSQPSFGLTTSYEPIGSQLVIIRTVPGAAGTIAVDLDSRRLPEVAGTLAGDDTIFVAVRSRSAQGRLLAALRRLYPLNGEGERR